MLINVFAYSKKLEGPAEAKFKAQISGGTSGEGAEDPTLGWLDTDPEAIALFLKRKTVKVGDVFQILTSEGIC